MSQKKAQLLNPINGNINVTGVVTASSFVGDLTGSVTGNVTGTASTAQGLSGSPNITVGTITASGNVSVGGTLSYLDVTNIDSVGIITAQQGIQVLANGLDITGVSTFKSDASIADKIIHTGDTNTAIRFPAADTFTVETSGSEALRVDSSGNFGLGTDSPDGRLHVQDTSNDLQLRVGGTTAGRDPIIRLQGRNTADDTNVFADIKVDSDNQLLLLSDPGTTGGTINQNPVAIDGSGRLMLGTTTEGEANADDLTVATSGNTGITIRSGTTNRGNIYFSDGTSGDAEYRGIIEYNHDGDTLKLGTANNVRATIDSSGRILINNALNKSAGGVSGSLLQVEAVDQSAAIRVTRNSDSAEGPFLVFSKSRGTSINSNTVVQDDDKLGSIIFAGADGSDHQTDAASIQALVDGTPGSNDMPTRLVFSTTADGASSVTERLSITAGGGFHFTNGELIERAKVTNGKLSDNTDIDLENGMVHLFTTQETTTCTPNIRINSSTSLNSVMAVGETISVTLITTAAAAGYSAQLTIDGGAVTENWTGGSAPDEGGSSGVDIYAYTIIKTASATFTVVATHTKTS